MAPPMEDVCPVQNRETNLLELNLTGKDLYDIPDTVLQHTEVEVLKLSFNKLKTLPKGISRLSKLKYLWLDFNEFGRALGLEERDIEAIEVQHGRDLNEMKYQMLLCWQRKAGQSATMSVLISALRNTAVQENAIADELETLAK